MTMPMLSKMAAFVLRQRAACKLPILCRNVEIHDCASTRSNGMITRSGVVKLAPRDAHELSSPRRAQSGSRKAMRLAARPSDELRRDYRWIQPCGGQVGFRVGVCFVGCQSSSDFIAPEGTPK